MQQRADARGLALAPVVAAFCALSPNNAEDTNYLALDTCLDIVAGYAPETTPVIAYGTNKRKALDLLRGATISETLKGRKVTAFFHNTLDSTNNDHITVDGHMLGAWANQRFILRRNAEIHGKSEYEQIALDFRSAAECFNLPAPQFQATLWLAWKRINNILYSPQLRFELERPNLGQPGPLRIYRTSSQSEAGKSPRPEPKPEAWAILDSKADQSVLDFGLESAATGKSWSAC